MKIIVPAYFHPSSPFWTSLIAQSQAVEYAIINPNSGPGATKDAGYVSVVTAAQARGVSILGYVATTYAAKPLPSVAAEMQKYRDWYNVDGFFFDEAATNPKDLPYYAALYAGARGIVVLNPGAYPHQAYIEVADVLCVEERGTQVVEDHSQSVADWMNGQPPEKFFYIIYGVPTAARMRRILKRAAANNVGYVCVTNDVLPNPFDSLPAYWADECRYVLNP